MGQLHQIPKKMGQIKFKETPLLGIYMDILQTQRDENNQMKTETHCINDGEEMESISGSNRYTCHYCGSVWEIDREKGKVSRVEVIFEGH